MKMKFFEKTYLITLILFLLFLDVSVVFLCVFTFKSNISAEEDICASESFAIIESYGNDTEHLNFDSAYVIQLSYCNFYKERNIFLRFEESGEQSFSTVPYGLTIPEVGHIVSDKKDGKYYIIITDNTNDGVYKITYAKDITEVYKEFKAIAAWSIAASAAVSVCLAIILYIALQKI